jgi:hypothetical protein
MYFFELGVKGDCPSTPHRLCMLDVIAVDGRSLNVDNIVGKID